MVILRGTYMSFCGGGKKKGEESQFSILHQTTKTSTSRSFDLHSVNKPTQATLFPLFPHRSAKTANLSWRASIRIILVIIIIVSCPWVCPWTTSPCPQSPAFSRTTSLPSATLMRPARVPHATCIRPVSFLLVCRILAIWIFVSFFFSQADSFSLLRSFSSVQQWEAVRIGCPDGDVNDCVTMPTGFSGSRTCGQRRQAGISEDVSSFVREMKQQTSEHDDASHPTSEETKDVKIDATLTITSNDSKRNTWCGFVSDGALFLRGDGWADMDIREVSLTV